MAAPRFINELTAAGSLSAGAAMVVYQDGQTLRTTPQAIITEAESFTQSGTAVAENVQSWGRRIHHDVQSYGATGDGSTNDATAIQAAIDAAGEGGTVYFPKATADYFTSTTTLKIYEGQKWIGEGYDNAYVGSVINYTGSGNAVEGVTRASARIFNAKISDILLKGDGNVASSVGIDLRRVDKIFLERVHVEDFDIGIKCDGTGTGGFRNTFSDCRVIGNNTGIQVVTAANEQLILGGQISNNDDYGLDVQGGNSVSSIGVNYESNGVHVRTADANTRILFGRMESATTWTWQTTSAATYFSVRGVHRGSGARYSDSGIGTDIQDIDRNSPLGVSLIKNGGFEVWSVSTVPDSWTLNNVTAAEDTDAADVQEGSTSVLLTAAATSSGIFQDYSIPTFQRDGRREYLVTGWVKLGTSVLAALQSSPQETAGGTGAGFTWSPTRSTLSSNQTTVTDAGWQFVYQVVRPSSDATNIRIFLYPDRTNGSGTAHFDAITVTPIGGPDQVFYSHPQNVAPKITKVLSNTASLNFGDTASPGAADLTITVNGAADGDSVYLAIPNAAIVAGAAGFYAWVSGANTVTVRFWNASGGNLNPGTGTFRADVVKH